MLRLVLTAHKNKAVAAYCASVCKSVLKTILPLSGIYQNCWVSAHQSLHTCLSLLDLYFLKRSLLKLFAQLKLKGKPLKATTLYTLSCHQVQAQRLSPGSSRVG